MDALYVLNFALYVVRFEIDLRGVGLAGDQKTTLATEPGLRSDFVRA